MIQPVNAHLLIEPVKHESFIASDKGTYEEIGVVVATPKDMDICSEKPVDVGDRVFFDSWMAARYPKNDEEYFWLVPWSEVRAIEKNEKVPE